MSQSSESSVPANLPRGAACYNCRRRKIRCDGRKPKCGPCEYSTGIFADCEYPNGSTSQAERLENDIAALEMRLQELHTAGTSRSLSTHLSEQGDLLPSNLPSSMNTLNDLGPDARSYLISIFSAHSSKVGFFLNLEQFQNSAMGNHALGHPLRPAPSLLYAIYLWGAKLSRANAHPSSTVYDPQTFLSAALGQLSADLAGSHPQRAMHVLQAEILLSYYFLNESRNVEGVYHGNAAFSLAVNGRLHLIKSVGTDSHSREQVDAFWHVVILSNYWAALGDAGSFVMHDDPTFRIDTPWPADQYGNFPANSKDIIKRFLEGTSVDGISPLALHAKASILFKEATSVSQEELSPSVASPAHLDRIINTFTSTLPLLGQLGFSDTLLTTHILAYAATLKLAMTYATVKSVTPREREDARKKCVSAALRIARCLSEFGVGRTGMFVDPILVTLCDATCSVLFKALLVFRTIGDKTYKKKDESIDGAMKAVLMFMNGCAGFSPAMGSLLASIQREYRRVDE